MGEQDSRTLNEWRSGWSVVAVSTMGMATGAGLYHYVSSLFIAPLGEEFGWSRGDISAASGFGLIGALSAPFIGRLADRYGARRLAMACIVAMAAGFIALSAMTGVYWQFLAISALLGAAAPGCTTLIYGRAVNSWFDHGKGLALGVTAAGMSVGAVLFSPLVESMIRQFGSSGGYLTLAALMVAIALPLVATGLRERPPSDQSGASPVADDASPKPHWFRLMRNPTFWILAVAIFAANAPAAGVLTQFAPLLQDRGIFSPTGYPTLFAISVFAGRIGIGWLFDRFDARRVAAVVTVLGISGCLMMTSVTPVLLAPIAIVLIGLLQGAETDVLAYFVARHFGAGSFGTIYGLLLAISMAGTVVGIIGFGQLFDVFGSYDVALIGAGLLLMPAVFAYLIIPHRGTVREG
jgi:MFS family permease